MATKGRDELIEDLWEQVEFLERSNRDFDSGQLNEAKRIAVHIRVLLHKNGSVIHQLGFAKALKWIDFTGPLSPRNLAPTNPPMMMSNRFSGYMPPPFMRPQGPMLDFDKWWHNPVIRDPGRTQLTAEEAESYQRRQLSRKNVTVDILANRMGGAHVDERGHADYSAVVDNNSLGWTLKIGDGEPEPVKSNAIFAAVRIISSEVVLSLRQQWSLIK